MFKNLDHWSRTVHPLPSSKCIIYYVVFHDFFAQKNAKKSKIICQFSSHFYCTGVIFKAHCVLRIGDWVLGSDWLFGYIFAVNVDCLPNRRIFRKQCCQISYRVIKHSFRMSQLLLKKWLGKKIIWRAFLRPLTLCHDSFNKCSCLCSLYV